MTSFGAAAVVGQRGVEFERRPRLRGVRGEEPFGLRRIDLAREPEQLVEGEKSRHLVERLAIERNGVEHGALAISRPDLVFILVLEQIGIRRDAELGAVLADQLEAKGMDGAEERLAETWEQIAAPGPAPPRRR